MIVFTLSTHQPIVIFPFSLIGRGDCFSFGSTRQKRTVFIPLLVAVLTFFFLIFFVKRYWSFRQAVFALSFKEKTATWSPCILRMLVVISCHNSLRGHFLIGADNEGESMDQEGPLQDEAVKLAAVWGKLRHWAG